MVCFFLFTGTANNSLESLTKCQAPRKASFHSTFLATAPWGGTYYYPHFTDEVKLSAPLISKGIGVHGEVRWSTEKNLLTAVSSASRQEGLGSPENTEGRLILNPQQQPCSFMASVLLGGAQLNEQLLPWVNSEAPLASPPPALVCSALTRA